MCSVIKPIKENWKWTFTVRNINLISEAVIKPNVWPLSSPEMTCWGQPSVFRCRSERGTDVRYTWYKVGHPNNIFLHYSTDLYLHCSNITEDSQLFCLAFNDVSSQSSEIVSLQLLQSSDKDCVYLISSNGEFNGQWFSILFLGTHRSAHFACLLYLTHLIQIISSLGERSINCNVCVR